MKKTRKKERESSEKAHAPAEEIPLKFRNTSEIQVSKKIIDQVIGQDKAVEIIKKAAKQRRNILLLGSPGTGKSMLAQGMAELMPAENLEDVLIYPNQLDENNPRVRIVPTYPKGIPPENAKEEMRIGQGRRILFEGRMHKVKGTDPSKALIWIFAILIVGLVLLQVFNVGNIGDSLKGIDFEKYGNTIAALILGVFILAGMWLFTSKLGSGMMRREELVEPKLIIDNTGKRNAPFVEATGAKAGALFGDVKHDPLQCIPGDELVHLPNGKPVKINKLLDPLFKNCDKVNLQLKESDQFEILSGYDEKYAFVSSKVSNIFRREYDGELIEVTTRRGYKIKVTPNHPLAVFRGEGRIDYTRSDTISKGDYIAVPDKLPIDVKSKLDENEIIFFADLLADGTISERSVTFKLRNEFKIKTIFDDIKKLGFNPRVLKRGQNTIIYLNSAAFVKKLNKLGLKAKTQKTIPAQIYDLSLDDIKLFLSRYLSLDGYINKQGQFELLSKEMIPDFIPLLLKIGIKAKYKPRIDRGFAKGKLQPRIMFSNYEFAKSYAQETINPIHKTNVAEYLSNTESGHVTYDDAIPINFDILEKFRLKIGLSKEKIDDEYYALKSGRSSSKIPTRGMLTKVLNVFMQHTNGKDLFALRDLIEGTYAYDEIVEIKKILYSGYVYNMTTETGTYLVNNILTHNTGGLGTPSHLRVEAGAVHRANKGVLYLDEIGTLSPKSQQDLLSAMQEKKFPITGQSEMSSGALTRTEPVPCDFVLAAAGNMQILQNMHPALRSRIRGYGYEIYLNDTIPDTPENRAKIARFVAQEVKKDGKIAHFTRDAVYEIIMEARKRAGRKGKLSLKLRELGGLIRAAGDFAKEENAPLVDVKQVKSALGVAQTAEQQLAEQLIEVKREYSVLTTGGYEIGKVNGLAVIGEYGGLVMPLVAEVTPASSRFEGKVIATGKLGKIAKEAVANVSAVIKKYMMKDVTGYDIHIQFLQTYEGLEGDSASISVALAVLSAMEMIPIRQDTAMTGSISVRGEVLPVGGVTSKIDAAISSGIKRIIVPKGNVGDVALSKERLKGVEIIPAETIIDVIIAAMKEGKGKQKLIRILKKKFRLNGKKK